MDVQLDQVSQVARARVTVGSGQGIKLSTGRGCHVRLEKYLLRTGVFAAPFHRLYGCIVLHTDQ